MHHQNAAKRAIRTFKAHFLTTLAGTCAQFPNVLWDQLLEQADPTLNIMHQATANPTKAAWEYLHGRPCNYDSTPIGTLGIPIIIHNKPIQRRSWYYRGRNGFSAGVVLKHYF